MAAITTITTERFLQFWSKVTDDLCVPTMQPCCATKVGQLIRRAVFNGDAR
jgi:hypothetical protein